MSDALFVVGTLLVMLPIAYAWWVKVRVIRLRQDMYDKRDELFDRAVDLGALDDPAYRTTRDHLNAVAAVAPDISIPWIMPILLSGREGKEHPKSSNPELQRAIDEIMQWSANRLGKYLLTETLSGLALCFTLTGFLVSEMGREALLRGVNHWFWSGEAVAMEQLRCTAAT